jgi:hypothetical protein
MKKILICLLIGVLFLGVGCATKADVDAAAAQAAAAQTAAEQAAEKAAADRAAAERAAADARAAAAQAATAQPAATGQQPVGQPATGQQTAISPANSRNGLDLTDAQEYYVVRGDTISEITRRYYGGLTDVGEAGTRNGFYFPIIVLGSDEVIMDPDLIEIDMELTIVDLKRNLANPTSRQAIINSLNDAARIYDRKGDFVTAEGLRRLADSL